MSIIIRIIRKVNDIIYGMQLACRTLLSILRHKATFIAIIERHEDGRGVIYTGQRGEWSAEMLSEAFSKTLEELLQSGDIEVRLQADEKAFLDQGDKSKKREEGVDDM